MCNCLGMFLNLNVECLVCYVCNTYVISLGVNENTSSSVVVHVHTFN